jgi:hypothetical protein
LRALSGCAAFRFILCHDRRARSSLKGVERAKLLADSDAIQMPQRSAPLTPKRYGNNG